MLVVSVSEPGVDLRLSLGAKAPVANCLSDCSTSKGTFLQVTANFYRFRERANSLPSAKSFYRFRNNDIHRPRLLQLSPQMLRAVRSQIGRDDPSGHRANGYVRSYGGRFKAGSDDNPTVGIILCTDKDASVVRYSVLHENEQIFASRYRLVLPSEEELRAELERERSQLASLSEDTRGGLS